MWKPSSKATNHPDILTKTGRIGPNRAAYANRLLSQLFERPEFIRIRLTGTVSNGHHEVDLETGLIYCRTPAAVEYVREQLRQLVKDLDRLEVTELTAEDESSSSSG